MVTHVDSSNEIITSDELTTVDLSNEIIKRDELPLTLDSVVLKLRTPVVLDLIDWEEAGLRIVVSVEGLGDGYYNEVPYADRATALAQYAQVLDKVRAGQYSLELHEKGVLKLNLTD